MKQFPFREDVDGYSPESLVWNQLSIEFITRCVNVPLRIYYLGGLTSSFNSSNSDGATLYAREILERYWKWILFNPLAILKQAALYTRFGLHLAARKKDGRWPLKGLAPRLLAALMWPVGFARYRLDLRRQRLG